MQSIKWIESPICKMCHVTGDPRAPAVLVPFCWTQHSSRLHQASLNISPDCTPQVCPLCQHGSVSFPCEAPNLGLVLGALTHGPAPCRAPTKCAPCSVFRVCSSRLHLG